MAILGLLLVALRILEFWTALAGTFIPLALIVGLLPFRLMKTYWLLSIMLPFLLGAVSLLKCASTGLTILV